MKPIVTLLTCFFVLALSATLSAQSSPVLQLLGQLNPHSSTGYNDCWGYTAPDGKEYALLGVLNGTSVIDISDAANPVEISFIPSASSTWKDIKTYGQYAYVVNESSGGLQIIDLSNLPTSATLAGTYTAFSTSHNIYIDESAGILYVEGSASAGVRVLSLADPLQPVELTTISQGVHDVFSRNGLLFLSEGGNSTYGIYNVDNPGSPSFMQEIVVPGGGYAHNAWSNSDNSLLMTTEETTGQTIKLWDISNLSNITLTDEVLGSDALAHNAHIKGHYSYVSHYGNGLIIYDISDPYNVVEDGHYDTFPGGGGGFVGSWGAWPFFDTGKVIISDQSTGLYIVYHAGADLRNQLDPLEPDDVTAYSDYNTPNSIQLSWSDPSTLVNGTPIASGEFVVDIERDGALVASVNGGDQQYTDNGLTDGQTYNYQVSTRISANDSTSLPVTLSWTAGGARQPSAPENLTIENRDQQLLLLWTNPATNVDGTPLDDLAEVRVYDDNQLLTTVARSGSSAGTADSLLITPQSNNSVYHITAVDNESPQNESPISNTAVGPLKAPFADNWNQVNLNETFWPVDGRQGDPRTEAFPGPYAMPSTPYVLRIEGDATLTSNVIDLSNQPQIFELRFWESEQDLEIGESVHLEYRSSNGTWLLLHRFWGTDNGYQAYEPFAEMTISLPAEAYHPQFQFRWRADPSMSSTDQWYFDDVSLAPVSGAPLLAVTPSSYSDSLDAGASGGFDITISNEALQTSTLDFTVSVISGSDWISVASPTGSIGSGSNQDVTISLSTTNLSPGQYSGTVSIDSDAGAPGGQQTKTLNVDLIVNSTTAIGNDQLPTTFAIRQNYPNPFNPETFIQYQLPRPEKVKIQVFNILGQPVRTLINANISAGYHQVRWDGRDNNGRAVSSGMYLYRIDAGEFHSVRKMILLQ